MGGHVTWMELTLELKPSATRRRMSVQPHGLKPCRVSRNDGLPWGGKASRMEDSAGLTGYLLHGDTTPDKGDPEHRHSEWLSCPKPCV